MSNDDDAPKFFRKQTKLKILHGRHAGKTGFLRINVFQQTADRPDKPGPAVELELDDKEVVTVRNDWVTVSPAELSVEP